jgi:polysaccharide deacetylase family sporulation protein PdaB
MQVLKRIFAVLSVLLLCISVSGEEHPCGSIYYSVNTDGKYVALTFDDGPHKYRTDEILDILEENDIKATFFTVGIMAKEYPEIIRRIVSEGHEIGNHTYSHSKMKRLSPEKLEWEIDETEKILYEICEYRPKLFRPPEGWCSDIVASIAAELDYDIILWNIDTLDWAHNSAVNICDSINCEIKPGSIILFHDYVSGKSTTTEALKSIIPKLKVEGYEFVTVSELINKEKIL